jgi:hypothetical protein
MIRAWALEEAMRELKESMSPPKVSIHQSTLEKLCERCEAGRSAYVYVFCMATGRILAFGGEGDGNHISGRLVPGSWYPLFWNPKFGTDGTFLGVQLRSGKVICAKVVATDPAPGALFEVVIVPDTADEDISALVIT